MPSVYTLDIKDLEYQKFEDSTYALKTIEYEHHEIHEGEHYFICGFHGLGDGLSTDFAVTTPNTTKWAHMVFEISGVSRTETHIYEDATVTSGSSVIRYNNNRNSLNSSTLTVVRDPGITTLGTEIFSQSGGLEGTTPSKSGAEGIIERSRELILKQNSTYVFRITSRDDANIISYCGEWYEHSDKD